MTNQEITSSQNNAKDAEEACRRGSENGAGIPAPVAVPVEFLTKVLRQIEGIGSRVSSIEKIQAQEKYKQDPPMKPKISLEVFFNMQREAEAKNYGAAFQDELEELIMKYNIKKLHITFER